MLRSLPLAALALAAPLAGAAQPVPPGTAGTAILRACGAGDLTAAVLGEGAATLHREIRIGLTNASQRPCAIDGYPAVRLIDEAGNVQILAETFAATPPPREFILAPGSRASFTLRVAAGDGTVTYRTVPTLAIVPPGGVAAVMLPFALPVAPQVEVGALEPVRVLRRTL